MYLHTCGSQNLAHDQLDDPSSFFCQHLREFDQENFSHYLIQETIHVRKVYSKSMMSNGTRAPTRTIEVGHALMITQSHT